MLLLPNEQNNKERLLQPNKQQPFCYAKNRVRASSLRVLVIRVCQWVRRQVKWDIAAETTIPSAYDLQVFTTNNSSCIVITVLKGLTVEFAKNISTEAHQQTLRTPMSRKCTLR